MKYNTATKGRGPSQKTTNLAGGEAYTLDNRTALYMTAATSLGGGAGDKYYVSANQEYNNILALVQKVASSDPEFVFQLAAYCRQDLHLRSIPTVLFVEGIRALQKSKVKGAPYAVDATKYAPYVIDRADEIIEAMAYWLHVEQNNIQLPAPLRKSLNIALNKFDEYRLLKYNQQDKAVTFRDIVRLVHPEPKNDVQSAIFKYFVKDEINKELMPKTVARKALLSRTEFDDEARRLITESHATWETVVSKFGNSKAVWEAVLPNMGYMALLRNINNFMKAGVDANLVIKRLTDPNEVRNSKQLPFRFYSALKALGKDAEAEKAQPRGFSWRYISSETNNEFSKWKKSGNDDVSRYRKALGIALNLAVQNISQLTGRTVVAADLSGSMDQALNAKSTVSMREIACVMGGIASQLAPDNIACGFGDNFAVAKTAENALETANNLNALQVGCSTNAHLILQYLLDQRIFVDRVMYFTDTQCYESYWGASSLQKLWEKYKSVCQASGKNVPFMYEVNLAGGNTSNFKADQRVAQIGGFSERIFDLITTYETNPIAVVKKIKEKYS